MSKKNDKRLCWSCDAEVSYHITKCPYCAADMTKPQQNGGQNSLFRQELSFASPFQTAPQESKQTSTTFSSDYFPDQFSSSPEEPVAQEKEKKSDKEEDSTNKKEMTIFLLLLPGIVFFLFGLILLLFAEGGVLTLSWNQNLALFYFLTSLPLIYFGYKSI